MTRYDWLTVAATLAFIVALAVIASGPGGGFFLFLKDQATAAWVQGIGSIVAIAAAIWIDRGSARRAIDKEVRDRANAKADWEACLSMVVQMGRNAEALMAPANKLRDPDHARRLIENATLMIDTYLRQPPPDPRLAFALSSVRSHMDRPRDLMNDLYRLRSQKGIYDGGAPMLDSIHEVLAFYAAKLEALKAEYEHGLW